MPPQSPRRATAGKLRVVFRTALAIAFRVFIGGQLDGTAAIVFRHSRILVGFCCPICVFGELGNRENVVFPLLKSTYVRTKKQSKSKTTKKKYCVMTVLLLHIYGKEELQHDSCERFWQCTISRSSNEN